jgi:hypothetical protein
VRDCSKLLSRMHERTIELGLVERSGVYLRRCVVLCVCVCVWVYVSR